MKRSHKIAIGIQLASVMMSAQSQPHTYRGVIVNANCFQAAKIINRNSRGYVPSSGVNALTGNRYKPLNTVSMKKSILKHCPVNPGSTEFALLDESGNFFKLDETGNFEVLSRTTTTARKITVTILGTVDRETLNVKFLSTGDRVPVTDPLVAGGSYAGDVQGTSGREF